CMIRIVAVAAAFLTFSAVVARAVPTQEAYVKFSNPWGNENFGASVAVAGDTMVVGASAFLNQTTGAGQPFVFVRTGTNWTQQAYLKASNTGAGANFGRSVAISGDTVVVGADGESSSTTGVNGDQSDISAPGAGAAYVFVRDGATWTQQAYLKASNTEGAAP